MDGGAKHAASRNANCDGSSGANQGATSFFSTSRYNPGEVEQRFHQKREQRPQEEMHRRRNAWVTGLHEMFDPSQPLPENAVVYWAYNGRIDPTISIINGQPRAPTSSTSSSVGMVVADPVCH